ncbi:hypothetical protein [Peribacillus deserti]|uniref:hypothetical protein n=1 Tax=Peribacillus deserti TaxID=673318 RepID=UPI001159519B|nr:hypothetical protein [Peribacillus deserti]
MFWLSDFEFGKYDNLREAIQKGIPYPAIKLVHTEEYDGVTIVMYTAKPEEEELPFANYTPLAIAFFRGNDEEGWSNIGHNGWTHYENDNMHVYHEYLQEHDEKGNDRDQI